MFPSGLALSLPAGEIAAFRAPGSVFELASLDRAVLSPPVRAAIAAAETLLPRRAPARVVVRPEMFTQGGSADWLRARLGAIADHLCISDGATIRLLPGFANHVFFAAEGDWDAVNRRRALLRRAPELLGTLGAQVNTALAGPGAPPTVAAPLPADTPPDAVAGTPALRPFYLNRHSAADSAGRLDTLAPFEPARAADFSRVTYATLTDRALADPRVAAELAGRILAAYTDNDALLLLHVAPHARSDAPNRAVADAARFLARLAASPVALPRLPAANVVLVLDDPWHATLRALALPQPPALLLDAGFEPWRDAAALAPRVSTVTLLDAGDALYGLAPEAGAIEAAFGRPVATVAARRDHDALDRRRCEAAT